MSTPWTGTKTCRYTLPSTLSGLKSHRCCLIMAQMPLDLPLSSLKEQRGRQMTQEAGLKRSPGPGKMSPYIRAAPHPERLMGN